MLLNVRGLNVNILRNAILKDVNFTLPENACVGIVGGSGSGKTMFARTLMGLLPETGIPEGEYTIDGTSHALDAKERQWRTLRGDKIGLVMQDPFTSLNPMEKCGRQILAGLRGEQKRNFDLSAALKEVGLAPETAERYPFELSGGMRQRVVIAAALATQPQLLIADEATTALDVITEREILNLLDSLRKSRGMSLIIITHDFSVVSARADYLIVFHEGRIVERGPTQEIIASPKDAYTKLLLRSHYRDTDVSETEARTPDISRTEGVPATRRILTVENLTKRFGGHTAVNAVNIYVDEGECVGIVGESGSGKTTLARCIIGLTKADEGSIAFSGAKIADFSAQIVFQDPYSSLNPALRIRTILSEALRVAKRPVSELSTLFDLVDLPHSLLDRRPAALSGGQRQRIAIARALAPGPRLLICDECVSSLDVIVQEQILETLRMLRVKQNLTILFITHDLSVVRRIADRIYVMKDAVIVEEGRTEKIFKQPEHAYTKLLLKK